MYAEMLATLAPGTAAQTAQTDSSDTFEDATIPPQVAISTSTPPIHPIQSPPTQATTSHPVNTIAETSSLTASPQLAAKFSALAHPQNPTGDAVPERTPVEDVESLPHESDEKSETSDESTDSDEKSETSDESTDSDDSEEALTQSIEEKALAPTEDGTADTDTADSELSKKSESAEDNSDSDSDSEKSTGDNTDTDSESEKSGEDLETVTHTTIPPTTSSPTVTPVPTETFTPLSTLSPNTLPMTATLLSPPAEVSKSAILRPIITEFPAKAYSPKSPAAATTTNPATESKDDEDDEDDESTTPESELPSDSNTEINEASALPPTSPEVKPVIPVIPQAIKIAPTQALAPLSTSKSEAKAVSKDQVENVIADDSADSGEEDDSTSEDESDTETNTVTAEVLPSSTSEDSSSPLIPTETLAPKTYAQILDSDTLKQKQSVTPEKPVVNSASDKSSAASSSRVSANPAPDTATLPTKTITPEIPLHTLTSTLSDTASSSEFASPVPGLSTGKSSQEATLGETAATLVPDLPAGPAPHLQFLPPRPKASETDTPAETVSSSIPDKILPTVKSSSSASPHASQSSHEVSTSLKTKTPTISSESPVHSKSALLTLSGSAKPPGKSHAPKSHKHHHTSVTFAKSDDAQDHKLLPSSLPTSNVLPSPPSGTIQALHPLHELTAMIAPELVHRCHAYVPITPLSQPTDKRPTLAAAFLTS